MSRLHMFTVSLLLLLPATLARADANDAAGRKYFASATEHYQNGRFLQAEATFSAGYELTHRPGFLWNMAECARSLGHKQRAVELYRQYVAEAADGPKVADAKLRLAELAPAPADPAAPPAEPAPTPVNVSSAARNAVAAPAETTTAPTSRPLWIGVVLGTVGGVGLAGGAALEIAGAIIRADMGDEGCPGRAESCSDDLVRSNNQNNLVTGAGIGALSLGVLATGAMIAYLVWPEAAPDQPELAIVPWVSPDTAGGSLELKW